MRVLLALVSYLILRTRCQTIHVKSAIFTSKLFMFDSDNENIQSKKSEKADVISKALVSFF